ncbi:MAG: hypothetical protein IJJ71_13230 [Treponema sp.]|uniref:DUF7577 domain-containing protein n=1 Tax=Treponema sp. TaxID=166 RepID=UPI0025D4F12D|nr:zinc-ribbon domain-containing protein [Treponema sp.]MBR0497121.1 hypothetical protein [Treponema sp.]
MSFSICPACSAENRPLAKFCRKCGTRLPNQSASSEQTPAVSHNQPVPVQPHNAVQEDLVSVEKEKSVSKTSDLDFIALEEIRSRLENFINTLVIRKKQKEVGMPINEATNVLVFRGETGTGKSIVAEWFISLLKKSNCLFSSMIARTTAHKLQRQYATDSQIEKYLSEQRPGVFLIDEVHNDKNYLYELLLGLTEQKSQTICILLGLKDELESFF